MEVIYCTENEDTRARTEAFIHSWHDDSTMLTVHTSGSTGAPKAITLSKEHMRISAEATLQFLGIPPSSSCLLCLSPATIGGTMMIVRAIVGNLRLFVVDATANPLQNIHFPIDFAAMVPYQFEKIKKENPDQINVLRTLILGGAPFQGDMSDLNYENLRVLQTFGMTETISHFAMRPLYPASTDLYTCLPGVAITSDDGHLIVDYPAIGVHQLKTNDAVTVIDRTHFEWHGRTDFVINSGGLKLHPEKLEKRLSTLIPVPYFLIGIPDHELGQKMILCIEGNRSDSPEKSALAGLLSRYEVPKEIRIYTAFARTNSGKIQRQETLKSPFDVA